MQDRMTNKEEAQLLLKWWKDYGQGIVIAVLIGLAIGFGYKHWKAHRHDQAMAASILYQRFQAETNMGQQTQSAATLAAMKNKFAHSVYTQLAALSEAAHMVSIKQYPQALGLLQPVAAKASLPMLQQMASIRIARIQLQLKQPKKALLALVTVSDTSLLPVIKAVRAQAYGQLGQTAQANKSLNDAISAYQKHKLDPSLLQLNAGLKH